MFTNENFCSLPDRTSCLISDDADAGQPTDVQDAATFYDAGPSWDASGGGSDASVAVQDAGTPPDGSPTLTNPCEPVDCVDPEPERTGCGDGTQSDVVCQPSFFGDCRWHFVCGTP